MSSIRMSATSTRSDEGKGILKTSDPHKERSESHPLGRLAGHGEHCASKKVTADPPLTGSVRALRLYQLI